MKIRPVLFGICLFLCISIPSHSQEGRALSLEDIMKFKSIQSSAISDNGEWVLCHVTQDRGDPEVLVLSANGKKKHTVSLAEGAIFSNDGKWVAMKTVQPLEESLRKKKDDKTKYISGLVLLETSTGNECRIDSVQSFTFSNDSKWLIYQKTSEKEKSKEGTDLILKSLTGSENVVFDFVSSYSVDSAAIHIACVVSDTLKENNGLYISSLDEPVLIYPVLTDSLLWVDELCWNNVSGELYFLSGLKTEKDQKDAASLYSWAPGEKEASMQLSDSKLEDGWKLYHTNKLIWSRDGKRLFLGIKPVDEIIPPDNEDEDTIVDVYSVEKILAKKEGDVWHWNDPYIVPNQKIRWKTEKDRTYACVYFSETGEFVKLASEEVPSVRTSGSSKRYLLGTSNQPYAKMLTWDGWINDYYRIDILTGEKILLLEAQRQDVELSPDGRFVAFYKNGNWYLEDMETFGTRCLTDKLGVSFSDEDWDYPEDIPGYGVGGWIENSEAVLIYDKFDIWKFPVNGEEPVCLTKGEGRNTGYQFRIRNLDREKLWLKKDEKVLLTAYNDQEKNTAVYSLDPGKAVLNLLADGPYKYTVLSKAKDADKLLFSRESYTEYPDIRISDMTLKKPVPLTDLGKQTEGFAWGNAELVEWNSMDGIPLQGILIKPGNYDPSKKYPVLVYYYRFFTPRMYDFPDMVINHRPNFAFYTSNDYAIFLPDIRFDIGTPGYSATKCLVPGVQKLIDMGVADPEAIALHGHSWSGYQTAFIITQTDIFAAAIAGAPVSNMTSAYSGIRWGSGMARQFQYEQSQSRIGATLWEARDKYIENSPVFYADRINTPLLIMFGDEDDAVPWYQGIELYLAMRRLEKDCIFLQYRGEPHHPKKYANKLDYTIRFKEYLDYYLKGEEPAGWITDGEPYRGR